MVFLLKAREIEKRLANSNKGNSIPILDGASPLGGPSLLQSGEFCLYKEKESDKAKCGQLIDIQDLRDISKKERRECGLPIRFGRGIDGAERYALIRVIIIIKEGVKALKLDPVEYSTMPKDLNEAIPTNQLTYIKAEEVTFNAYLLPMDGIRDGKYKGMEMLSW